MEPFVVHTWGSKTTSHFRLLMMFQAHNIVQYKGSALLLCQVSRSCPCFTVS